MSFSLAPDIYAAKYEDSVIILDVKANNYLSFIGDAAIFFCFILKHSFTQEDGLYTPKSGSIDIVECNEWIEHFLEEEIIIQSNSPTVLAEPIQAGGLKNYRWDQKNSWSPFALSSWMTVAGSLPVLHWVHQKISCESLISLFQEIQNNAPSNAHEPPQKEIAQLANAVDAATMLYPKKSFCLAWATTFVLLAMRKKWKINLAFGVQLNPFYAHAWAETPSGLVINDSPMVNKSLSVLCRHPYT